MHILHYSIGGFFWEEFLSFTFKHKNKNNIPSGYSGKQLLTESGHKIFPFAALYFFQRSTQAFCK
jgi:hypothetical protein